MQMMLSRANKKLWMKESMAAAVSSIEDGMGIREASRLYNVSCETLRQRVNHVVVLECRSPPTVLTEDEEHQVAMYCVKMADIGFVISRDDVMHTAYKIVEASGRKLPSPTEQRGGLGWIVSGLVILT